MDHLVGQRGRPHHSIESLEGQNSGFSHGISFSSLSGTAKRRFGGRLASNRAHFLGNWNAVDTPSTLFEPYGNHPNAFDSCPIQKGCGLRAVLDSTIAGDVASGGTPAGFELEVKRER